MTINIRLNWGPKFIYAALLLLSLLALEVGYSLERGTVIFGRALENHLVGHLISEIGIAGLVGFILALTFERLSAGEFRKLAEKEREAIKTDVFHYVYGYGIPREITDMIDKQILRTMFVRRNMKATFTLETIEGPDSVKYVRAERELSYEIENLTDHAQPFPFVASTDTAPISGLTDEAKFLRLNVTGCEAPFALDSNEIIKLQNNKDLEKYLEISPAKITVLPETRTTVTVVSQTVKYLNGGCLYLILSHHTCELELLVRVPSRDLDIVVTPYADNVLKKTRTHDPVMGMNHWNIGSPVLAYQGINVAWKPK